MTRLTHYAGRWMTPEERDALRAEANRNDKFADDIPCPMVMSDIGEYRSPIDGRYISSRSTRKRDLADNGCVEAPDRKPKAFKNERFCKKHGLPFVKPSQG